MQRRKLIEVALPLEEINRESAREKSIRHGHPSTLHLWWSRKPTATARAVLFAQLVDDPSSDADAYREEAIADGVPADQVDEVVTERVTAERERLHDLIRRLVVWENINDTALYREAQAEILRSTGGNPPPILDPFCGGGTIPLEAQRLGLEAHASDLNPVAVLITKALIEIPPTFAGRTPVFPGAAESRLGGWPKATGLAEDVRRYGQWMRDEAEKRMGHLYPKATLPDGSKATVIAWVWARTVACPNPLCGIQMPLTSKWWLGKKKGKEAYVVPSVEDGQVHFTIGHDPKHAPTAATDGTVSRTGATCINCKAAVPIAYVRGEGRAGRLGAQLMATVAEGKRQRVYLAPTTEHATAAVVDRPGNVPVGEIATNPRWFSTPAFGMTTFADLFTNRQLTALTTFSDLVGDARNRVYADAISAGTPSGERLADGGTHAAAYADAVSTYLTLAVSRLASTNSSICRWNPAPSKESVSDTFGRQAIPMVWEFAEGNPWSKGPCNLGWSVGWVCRSLENVPSAQMKGHVEQRDASDSPLGELVATDPPYYDNIGYSDLSDFFYVWLRRSAREVFPELMSTMLVPKSEELVANPYRHDGKEGAEKFFQQGFNQVFRNARQRTHSDFPITVFYAFKQSETEDAGTVSTGWQKLLEGMIGARWSITGTWPMRSERGGRMTSIGTNALASSIVLALRPREGGATADRRTFIARLRSELPEKIREMQHGSIAPVDLPQAAIGPGMAIFSSYSKVLESDGGAMSVKSALQVINQALGEVLSEQEGDFDAGTRWCLKWFEARAFEPGPYGEAETLASAYNTSVAGLDRSGALTARGGKVGLIPPADLPDGYDPRVDDHITLWEVVMHLTRALDEKGLDAAGTMMARSASRVDVDAAKELAYILYSIAERKKWSAIGQLFNMLAASWSDVADAAKRSADDGGGQLTLGSTY